MKHVSAKVQYAARDMLRHLDTCAGCVRGNSLTGNPVRFCPTGDQLHLVWWTLREAEPGTHRCPP